MAAQALYRRRRQLDRQKFNATCKAPPDLAQGISLGNVSLAKEAMPAEYRNLLKHNPLLVKCEADCKLRGWDDLEIRTAQLCLAIVTIGGLQQQYRELQELMVSHQPR